MMDIKSVTNQGWEGGVICLDIWENNKNSTHTIIKFYIIFIWIFFYTMDIKKIKYGGAGKGRAGGIICSEKWENHQNSTHTKIKFYMIFRFFFSTEDIKNVTNWGREEQGGKPWVGVFFFTYFYIISSM